MSIADRAAADRIAVLAPADGRALGSVGVLDADTIARKAAAARAARPAWAAAGFGTRGEVLHCAARWLMDHRHEVVRTICAETGKTWEDAFVIEVGYAANALHFWARQAPRYLASQRIRSRNPFVAGRSFHVHQQPVGLVGVIGPWNFPLLNSFGDCIPALAAGNAVLLKPSELTPMTSLLMRRCMNECGLPEGIFDVITGGGEAGEALIDEADMVMFTGSTATGRKILERAARTLTPVCLELGGKDPMIVLDDANLSRAVEAAAFFSTNNSGQVCIATERIYVHEAV